MKREEYEFLPAVLEVQETPPSPLGRALLWLIVGFFALAILWACVGEVDIVAAGQGKLIPVGKSKTIQPLDAGLIRAIHVAEGQEVQAGQALIDLDPTETEADRTRLAQELAQARADAARASALLLQLERCGEEEGINRQERQEHQGKRERKSGQTPLVERAAQKTPFARSSAADAARSEGPVAECEDIPRLENEADAQAQALLAAQWQEYAGKREALNQALAQRRAELQITGATIEKLAKTLPLISERAQALKDLDARKLASHHEALSLEQQRLDTELSLKAEQARRPQLHAAIRQAEEQLAALAAETRRMTLEQQAQSRRQIDGLTQELAKAAQRQRRQTLSAPIDGTEQQLAVTTLGGVVTPAQALMVLVPRAQVLEAEVFFENKDIGFLKVGQEVALKLEAFPFTRYGLVEGRLASLSHDAVLDEKRGPIYAARIALKQDHIAVDGVDVALSPGMTLAAEAKTGRRKLIDYLLSPISEAVSESARER